MSSPAPFRLLAVLMAATLQARAADPWSTALKRRGIDPALVENPIAITAEIKAAAAEMSGRGGGTVDALKRLQSGLFDTTRFTFDYESALTATAADALAAGRGNCVSFTNLFIAMGRSRGFNIQAGYIQPRAKSERRGDLVYIMSHVVAVYPLHDRYVVFDFYRTREDPAQRIRLLNDFELAALYVNNRAVEALSAGDYETAEARLAAVLKLAPDFAPAYGNLGVLLRRRGDISGAIAAYRRALALAPRDPSILGNLAALYTGLGREREAKAALTLADLSVATPYTILARGDLEAADGRVDEALRYYRKAARLDPKIPDPHLSIARVARASGRLDQARHEAERALELDSENAEAKAMLAELAERAPR
jgi:tetratricopeptide (TPR) repeat protein